MNIIVVPDSFKETLSSVSVSDTVEQALLAEMPQARVTKIPIADGGEGTLDCFAGILGGKLLKRQVTGPNFQKVEAGILLCGEVAVIEMAQAAGLPLAAPKDAKSTTTYGVGEMMLEAERLGAKRFVMGIGGSATNDGGCGMAAALGTKFFDENGAEFIPVGATLKNISRIEFGRRREVTVLCDVRNPLYGENGAAYVYAPQKGADESDVAMLDEGLRHLAEVLEGYGFEVASLPGAGAAGGLGAGLSVFCSAKLQRGVDAMLDAAGFDEKAANADVIITGEGALDSQSFSGKVIDGIVARSAGKPVIAVVGISKLDNPAKYGLTAVFESNYQHKPFEQIKASAGEDLAQCAARAAEFISKLQ